MADKQIAVILSGGGVKGVGHLALLEELECQVGRPDIISCSSAGSLIGAMYAAGRTSAEIRGFFKESPLTKLNYISRRKPGFFDSKKYITLIKEFIPATFEELDIPIVIVASNLETGEAEYFDKGDLYKPLIASCAVPFIFSPVNIDGACYIDGGATDNFPISPVLNKGYRLIGSYVSAPNVMTRKELNTSLKVVQRANSILLYRCNNYKFELTEQTVSFPLGQFGLFETKKTEDIYQYCKDYLKSNHISFKEQISE